MTLFPMDAGRRSERDLVERLQRGDEQAFIALVELYQTQMIRVALRFVPTPEVAEDVVQDAWLGVVRGIDRFGEQSSLRTWLFHIVANRARTAGAKERRHTRGGAGEPVEDPTRFAPDGTWAVPLPHWSDEVDDRMTAESLTACIHHAVSNLPRAAPGCDDARY